MANSLWNVRILHTTTKKGFRKQKCQLLKGYVNVALNTWSRIILNKSVHQWGMAWRWSAFDTAEVLWKHRFELIGLKLICVVGSGVSHPPLDNTTDFLWALVEPSNIMVTTPVSSPFFSTFASVGRCQVLLTKGSPHLHKACQPTEAQSALKYPGWWQCWLWTLIKQWSKTTIELYCWCWSTVFY